MNSLDDCRCGCPAVVHEHYRAGSDCGACGRTVCPAYRKPRTPLRDRVALLSPVLWLRVGLALWRHNGRR